MNALYLAFGVVFGFLLSRARATDYNTIVNMFRFTDLYLAGVMVTAIAIAAMGLYLLRRSGTNALIGCPVELRPKAYQRELPVAGLVFGAGWALSGA